MRRFVYIRPNGAAYAAAAVIICCSASASQARVQTPRQAARPAAAGGWVDVADKRWLANITLLAATPGRDEVLAGVGSKGLWKSTNGGLTWTRMGASAIPGTPVWILYDPKNPSIFWTTACHGGGLLKTTDGGLSFTRLGPWQGADGIGIDFTDPYRRTIITSEHEKGHNCQLSYSSGASWKDIGSNISAGGFNSYMTAIDDKTFLIAAGGIGSDPTTNGIYRTINAGGFWTRVCERSPVYGPTVASDGAIYWNVWPAGAVKSTDKGATWSELGQPFKTPIIELPDGKLAGATDTQLMISADAGRSWKAMGPKLPFFPTSLTYNAARRQFFVGTFSPPSANRALARWTVP